MSETSAKHILIIIGEPGDDREYEIECPGITDACRMWSDCNQCTPADRDALHEADQPVAHGIEHMLFSWGWSVPDGRCFVRDNDHLPDAAECLDNGVRRHGRHQKPLAPGRYPVTFDVEDEEDLTLTLVGDRHQAAVAHA